MQLTIVNMIENSLSGEINHDTEPNLAVNPANPMQIAGTAFSPDPTGGLLGPVYRSVDGGNTWDLPDLLPSQPNDQTLRFAGNSNTLYATFLDVENNNNLAILSKGDITAAGLMTQIFFQAGGDALVDQPYLMAASTMGGAGVNTDRVYVGGNNFSLAPQSSSIIQSMNANAATPTFTTIQLEKRTTLGQDGPQVRTAIHPDSTVYAVFFGWRSQDASGNITSDVVVMRDDNWGSSATPYSALFDTDGIAGKRAASAVFVFDYLLGNERTAGDLNIAVDPNNSSNVYVAWAGLLNSIYTIHLIQSTDRGATWSADLITIQNATHPCIAINSQGKIAFLYQQLTGTGTAQRWETHIRTSIDDGATWDDTLLCSAILSNPNNPTRSDFGLGDYTSIMAVGKNFYGIFPADNTPDPANFPSTATLVYNRNHNFAAQTLLAVDGVTQVQSSVDPFYFQMIELAPTSDFYVRDWTNSATSYDTGLEPSTNPFFYVTSDVWNQNSVHAPNYVNDQPQTETPTAGTGSAGDNYAYARVSRNDSLTAETVQVEFFMANYGAGIPYISLGTTTVSFAIGVLQQVVNLQWNLAPTTSNHVCLAAQISTPSDPFIPPSLLGNSPGWPTGDLMVINDNNKAQRNLQVIHVALGGTRSTIYYRIRNAATFQRDMILNWFIIRQAGVTLTNPMVEIVGANSKALKPGQNIVLKNMLPGENRWLSFSFDSFKAKMGAQQQVNFIEMEGNTGVNGFAITVEASPTESILKDLFVNQDAVLARFEAIYGIKPEKGIKGYTREIIKSRNITEKQLKLFRQIIDSMGKMYAHAIEKEGAKSKPDGTIINLIKNTITAIDKKSANAVISNYNNLLERLDIFLTMNSLKSGDIAEILFNVRWQKDILTGNATFSKLRSYETLINLSTKFIDNYSSGKITNKKYPEFIEGCLKGFTEIAALLKNRGISLIEEIEGLAGSRHSLQYLQKTHNNILLKIYTGLSAKNVKKS